MALFGKKRDEQPRRASVVVVSLGGREDLLPKFSHPLGEETMIIGRADSCSIQIVDPQISRQHLRLRYHAATGQYFASDMGSANGTAVNGVRLGPPPAETPVDEGDVIELGDSRLIFTWRHFDDHASALRQFRSASQRFRNTLRQ